ncbi:MAG: VOC family protein [Limisphaerales bacterium]
MKFRIEPMDCAACRMAMIFDPDGNTICIHKRNPK